MYNINPFFCLLLRYYLKQLETRKKTSMSNNRHDKRKLKEEIKDLKKSMRVSTTRSSKPRKQQDCSSNLSRTARPIAYLDSLSKSDRSGETFSLDVEHISFDSKHQFIGPQTKDTVEEPSSQETEMNIQSDITLLTNDLSDTTKYLENLDTLGERFSRDVNDSIFNSDDSAVKKQQHTDKTNPVGFAKETDNNSDNVVTEIFSESL